jgi:hypothetical protein
LRRFSSPKKLFGFMALPLPHSQSISKDSI